MIFNFRRISISIKFEIHLKSKEVFTSKVFTASKIFLKLIVCSLFSVILCRVVVDEKFNSVEEKMIAFMVLNDHVHLDSGKARAAARGRDEGNLGNRVTDTSSKK